MTSISNSTKFGDVAAALATLTGDKVSVQEIVDTILQISNFKEKTMKGVERSLEYEGPDGLHIKYIFVDMNYQRKIRLRKLINKLQELGKFDQTVAGSVDIAERPNGEYFVWDGLRRIIMAALTGMKRVKVNKMVHSRKKSSQECEEYEAFLLEVRNTKLEGMKPEEIFKAQVCRKDPDAMKLFHVLKNCSLDVEGVIGKGTPLGGFAELNGNFNKGHNLKETHLIDSSDIIRTAFNDPNSVSVFLFTGLAYLLQFMEDNEDEIDILYTTDEVKDAMIEYKKSIISYDKNGVEINPTQSDLCNPRINGKTCQSVAWSIATKVLKDKNGLRKALEDKLEDTNQILVDTSSEE